MTVFHYLMFYLLIWSNQIFSLSFVFSFLPIVFIYSQLYQRFGRKPVTLRLFTRQTKKGHTIIAECQIVSIHRKSYLQRFLHTLPFGAKKDPEPFLVRDLSKSIFSFLPTNWDFLFSRRFTVFICTYITPGMSACHDDFATGVFICVHLHNLRI